MAFDWLANEKTILKASFLMQFEKNFDRNILTSWTSLAIIDILSMTHTKVGFQKWSRFLLVDGSDQSESLCKPKKVKCLQRRLSHIINCINTCTTTSCIHRCSNGYWILIGYLVGQSEIEIIQKFEGFDISSFSPLLNF